MMAEATFPYSMGEQLTLKMVEAMSSALLHFASDGDWVKEAEWNNFNQRPFWVDIELECRTWTLHAPASFTYDMSRNRVEIHTHIGDGILYSVILRWIKSSGVWSITYPDSIERETMVAKAEELLANQS